MIEILEFVFSDFWHFVGFFAYNFRALRIVDKNFPLYFRAARLSIEKRRRRFS